MNLSDYHKKRKKYMMQVPFSNTVYRFPNVVSKELKSILNQIILSRTRCCFIEKHVRKRNHIYRFISGMVMPCSEKNMLGVKFNRHSSPEYIMPHKCVAIFSTKGLLYLKDTRFLQIISISRRFLYQAGEITSSNGYNLRYSNSEKEELFDRYYEFLKRKDFFL